MRGFHKQKSKAGTEIKEKFYLEADFIMWTLLMFGIQGK